MFTKCPRPANTQEAQHDSCFSHIIFKLVIVVKLVYAASSWWGFATADDRKRLQAVIRHGILLAFVNSTTKLSKN